MSLELKKKVAHIDDELRELREEHAEKVTARDEARDKFVESGNGTDSDEYRTAREAVREAGTAADQIETKQAEKIALLELLQDSSSAGGNGNGRPEPATPEGDGPREWSSAHLFDDDLKASLSHVSGTKSRVGSITIGEVANRERLAADITGTDFMRRGTYVGVVPQIYRPLRVLDLIPTGTTDGNLVPYTQEGGTFLAAETAEGQAKPEDGVTYTDADALVQTIAAWQKLRKQSLSDYAAIQSMIDGRLRYSVLRRLEGQVLAGNGIGSNLLGILNTPGIGSVAFNGAVPLSELILTGITNVYIAGAEATGIVMAPQDWQSALTQKAELSAGPPPVGSGEYVGGGPFANTPQIMWGVPLVPSPALAQGTALVGDFAIGAQLLIREGVNVLLSDSDQDDFIKNRITMLGEMRAALPVWRPVAFQKVALA